MSMDRSAVASHLAYQLSALAGEIGQAKSDASATGYGPDIDQALRQLGVVEADLATAETADADVPALLALAEYFALRRMARQLALGVDVSSGTMSQRNSQRAATVQTLMAEAAETAAGLGYPVTGTAAWGMERLSLDYLEPEPTA